MILTGGFDGFDVLTAGLMVLTVVLMVLMLLTVGFDDFDRWF